MRKPKNTLVYSNNGVSVRNPKITIGNEPKIPVTISWPGVQIQTLVKPVAVVAVAVVLLVAILAPMFEKRD